LFLSHYDQNKIDNFDFEGYRKNLYGIVRVKSLKNLIAFAWLVNHRLGKMDWDEWVGRDYEKRKKDRKSVINYLSYYDKIELEYYCERLGSERKVRDYWCALNKLLMVLGFLW